MAKRKDSKNQERDDSEQSELDELEASEERDLDDGDDTDDDDSSDRDSSAPDAELTEAPGGDEDADVEASAIGSARYVHAAFFGAGILAAYLCGKLLLALWNFLADWPEAVREVPFLIQYGEDERSTLTLLVGAVIGVLVVLFYYRKESVRSWAGEVASELGRVTWPNKDMVTNGTMVVLVASLVATVYVALLDRFWAYLTNLVYGA